MKRLLTLSGILVLCSSLVFAETSVLIDFSELADGSTTEMDYSGEAGASFTQEEKDQMKTSLAIENWVAELNSSAKTIATSRYTIIKPVESQFVGGTVLGVRANFPENYYNAMVTIKPPFSIPSMMPADGGQGAEAPAAGFSAQGKFDNKGVIKNVGPIKSVSINVRGLNFPHRIAVVIEDSYGKEKVMPMGDLNFDGWKTLTWNNPNYIFDARMRELNKQPLYPHSNPLIKFKEIRINKSSTDVSGDFIGYIKDITVTHDKAYRDDQPMDIDDEALWGILAAREQQRHRAEMARFGEKKVLEFIETQIMDNPENPTSQYPQDGGVPLNNRTNTPQGGGNQGGA